MGLAGCSKRSSNEAAGSEDSETYWKSTLRNPNDRERSWGPFSASCLVSEVAHAGENHRHLMLIGGFNDFLITNGATRLDYRRNPGLRSSIKTVAEGKEGIGGHDTALHRQHGFHTRQLH